jgi:hypothetical protein
MINCVRYFDTYYATLRRYSAISITFAVEKKQKRILYNLYMRSFFVTLSEKKQLTHDVYELIYLCDEEVGNIPGQFLLCDTDIDHSGLRRSYSISDYG